MRDEDCFLCHGTMKINHRLGGHMDCPDPDGVHHKNRERFRVERPRSLRVTMREYMVNGKEQLQLEIEYKPEDRRAAMEALYAAAQKIQEELR